MAQTLTWQWMASGVTTRALTRAKDKVTGVYVTPKTDGAKHPAVLFFGGSEGGVPSLSIPYLPASHGYPVLAVAYFHAPGVPAELRNVPIEYFATAARWLDQQPGVDPARVVVMSASFGTEAALLVADHFPALVHGAVLFAPGAAGTPSFPHPGARAWTYQGRPVGPELIPVDGVDGPVLAVAGSADASWDSRQAAEQIMRQGWAKTLALLTSLQR